LSESARFHDVGHALRQPPRQDEAHEQAEEQAAHGRRQEHLPPGEHGRGADQMLGAVAEEQDLDRGGQQSKRERAVTGRDADHEGEQEQQELSVTGDPPPGLRPGRHLGTSPPLRSWAARPYPAVTLRKGVRISPFQPRAQAAARAAV
jgi:hypothetical protein